MVAGALAPIRFPERMYVSRSVRLLMFCRFSSIAPPTFKAYQCFIVW